jgi:hypothetical protein
MALSDTSVGKVDVSAYTIPTDAPAGDGTLRWDSTTLIAGWLRWRPQYGAEAVGHCVPLALTRPKHPNAE